MKNKDNKVLCTLEEHQAKHYLMNLRAHLYIIIFTDTDCQWAVPVRP